MKTKEQAVREELRFGNAQDILYAVARNGLDLDWLAAISAGEEMTDGDVEVLFAALKLTEGSLEDEDDE